jgi:UDP-N-acetylglucosamine--N-acetylmuramyl-(pentapeptide) pyrophosphoryl-undecaprenol N-acetylglucosamine transferase
MAKRVLLVGGGSGGHVYPLIAVAQELRNQSKDANLLMIGEGNFARKSAMENNIAFRGILAGKLRRYFSFEVIFDFIKLPLGFIQSLWYVYWFMPNVVFSKGGFASIAPVLVARLYMIPVYIHESDSIPGIANNILSKFAKGIFVSFQSALRHFNGKKTMLVGNPIRKTLLGGDRQAAYSHFGFSGEKKTILILGGSQGAKQINEIILNSLVVMAKDFQIIHQAGDSQYKTVQERVDRFKKEGQGTYADDIEKNYRLYPFLKDEEMKLAYAVCDIVVSRAGAGSLFEIAAVGKPAVVVPLKPSASNHQLANASEFAKFGATIVEGANMTTNILLNQIGAFLEPQRYSQISEQIKSFAKVDAADKIAKALLRS